ncbi:MAG: tRNA (adenosine(37)-N6)-dimethylallyltransferase MiaA [Treponema sp.]|jgi:tRNA dimethylallyltransferase|nr:tRNA (adenosine(37)-N6)-dimethylallyltransferase MiaA [Treponema sp.]
MSFPAQGTVPLIPAVLLCGPTASGKTEILEELFAAPRSGPSGAGSVSGGSSAAYPAEIISADSMQVYRGMDIGTAKAPPELRNRLPHHLIDIRDPREQFNAGEFVRLADQACIGITRRGKIPVISGGTGFYLSNFILGLSGAPPSDPVIRRELREERQSRGIEALAEELVRCDPESARRIHIHDEYRLLRALEVYRIADRPLSAYPRPGTADAAGGGDTGLSGGGGRPRYRFLILVLDRPREEVYRRINERCAEMFRRGLPDEVRGLYAAGYSPDDPGMRAIGYREFFIGATGAWRISEDPAAAAALIAQNSRRYAKRQLTYFASIPRIKRISAAEHPAGLIRRELDRFLAPA